MTRSHRWLLVAALLPVAACSNNTPPAAAVPPPPPPLAAADQAFVNAAAASDAFEVQSGQLAATKARSARVKTFANSMVTAHGQTTQQLMTIAQSKNVTPDATLTPASQQMMAQLNSASPRSFDHGYVRDQIASHEAAEKVFQDEISNGQDADLKQFATSTLPEIQQHEKEARALTRVR